MLVGSFQNSRKMKKLAEKRTGNFSLAFFGVARLQSEFCTKDVFRATNFLTKNAPKFSPKILSLCSVGQKKSPENSLQISH